MAGGTQWHGACAARCPRERPISLLEFCKPGSTNGDCNVSCSPEPFIIAIFAVDNESSVDASTWTAGQSCPRGKARFDTGGGPRNTLPQAFAHSSAQVFIVCAPGRNLVGPAGRPYCTLMGLRFTVCREGVERTFESAV